MTTGSNFTKCLSNGISKYECKGSKDYLCPIVGCIVMRMLLTLISVEHPAPREREQEQGNQFNQRTIDRRASTPESKRRTPSSTSSGSSTATELICANQMYHAVLREQILWTAKQVQGDTTGGDASRNQ